METTAALERLQRRHQHLLDQLSRVGLVLQGTIQSHTICRTVQGQPKTYGPYHEWTWKHRAKTVTVNLTAAQARRYRKAIQNHRRMEALLIELRQVSRQILEATTKGVKKRKRYANQHLGHN